MKPLAGKTILITRPRAQSARLAARLRARGAQVRIAPLIRVAPPRSRLPLDRALRNLGSFDILIFTSANGVDSFFDRAPKSLKTKHLKICAIGPATAEALARRGVRGARVPDIHEGGALARSLKNVRGKKVLLARAQTARAVLPRALRRAGASVTIVPCYQTVPDAEGTGELRRLARDGGADWVTFTSASTVKHLFAALSPGKARSFLARTRAASIGPVTTAELRRRRITPAVEAAPYTAESLVRAIVSHERREPVAKLKKTLLRALREAGAIARGHFGKVTARYKGRANIVTKADLACEQRILDIILRSFPRHDFLAEERAPRSGGSSYTWIVDPIDGTTNYAHRFPTCCISIALAHRGVTVLGGVYDPFRDELFLAEKGKGATLNGKRIRVTRAPRLSEALLLTGFPYDRDKRARFYLDICRRFLVRCHGLRRSGSAALDLAWLASGRVDGYWEFHLNPWDVAAGRLLVLEAGGKVTDFSGKPFDDPLTAGMTTLATNDRLHPAMLRVLRGKK